MKAFLEVEKGRISYHQSATKNSVHRSSLLVPRFSHASTTISFLNHFLLKRNNLNVTLKITPITLHGEPLTSTSIAINSPKVYVIDLEELFPDAPNISEYLAEFFSNENLFLPFPAVIINHRGHDFVNTVHSYNRILNDVFEDDQINSNHVCETSIDIYADDQYDTFFNYATGPLKPTRGPAVLLTANGRKRIKDNMERLTNKNYFLSQLYGADASGDKVLKIFPPKQPLFYGRLLAGRINKLTQAFSANHSYYDSSSTYEYFENQKSSRCYPYFTGSLNRIIIFPIMSPSRLDIHIEICAGGEVIKSGSKTLVSPSSKAISFDIDYLVKTCGAHGVSLFKIIATTEEQRIPTRINHQLLNGDADSSSKLYSSINLSLFNEKIFFPPNKLGFAWGQIFLHNDYQTRLGICFNNGGGTPEDISIDFYGQFGLLRSVNYKIFPDTSLLFSNSDFELFAGSENFVWFVAQSTRPDISAVSFHFHKITGNASGEHSF